MKKLILSTTAFIILFVSFVFCFTSSHQDYRSKILNSQKYIQLHKNFKTLFGGEANMESNCSSLSLNSTFVNAEGFSDKEMELIADYENFHFQMVYKDHTEVYDIFNTEKGPMLFDYSHEENFSVGELIDDFSNPFLISETQSKKVCIAPVIIFSIPLVITFLPILIGFIDTVVKALGSFFSWIASWFTTTVRKPVYENELVSISIPVQINGVTKTFVFKKVQQQTWVLPPIYKFFSAFAFKNDVFIDFDDPLKKQDAIETLATKQKQEFRIQGEVAFNTFSTYTSASVDAEDIARQAWNMATNGGD